MAKRPTEHEEAEIEPEDIGITHPEEIRLEAQLTIRGRPTARAALRTTPAGVICAGLAVAVIILSSAAGVRIVGKR
jgi:hypothetical protein